MTSKTKKRTWGVLVGAAALTLGIIIPAGVSFADLPGGCDFSPANNGTPSCDGALTGSTFAGGDGNLLVNPATFGSTDWQNVAGLNAGFDLASGKGDNSLGQGTKEDDPNVTVVAGSIPPNKSDLTRFYEASEFSSVNNHNFLYLAWERTNVLGTANFDFEINQKSQPDLTTTGAKTLVRTAGDLLVTYDFNNGGGKPTIGLLRWVTSATVPVVPGFATNVCFSANSFPCWGDKVILDGTDSIAAVNNLDAVTDPLFPNGANYINPVPALQFGETAIDLTKAGVFPSGTCAAFGSTFVRSRSSSAFTSEIKDFIAPIPVNISNCGTVNIIKHTNPRGVDQNFSYTSTIPNPPAGQTPPTTPDCTNDTTPSSFTLNDKAGVDPAPITAGTDNTEHCANVPAGSYTVTEGAEPAPNWSLESLTCTATAGSSGQQHATGSPQADITLIPGGVVTCIYTNQRTDTTSMASAQTWMPNDSATVTATNGTALNGTLSTQLYTGDNCGVTSGAAVSGQLYTKTLTNATSAADRTVTSNNMTFTVSATGSVSWLVTFTSTDSNVSGSSHCEKTSLTINN
jgi:hypothetical protein